MATGYRLQHLLTSRLSEIAFATATSAALFQLNTAPHASADYIVVPIALPCDCHADYVAASVCCGAPMRGALVAGSYCPSCRADCEVVLYCPSCRTELIPELFPTTQHEDNAR